MILKKLKSWWKRRAAVKAWERNADSLSASYARARKPSPNRDAIAVQVLLALIACSDAKDPVFDGGEETDALASRMRAYRARAAYEYADCMLKESERLRAFGDNGDS